MSTADNVKDTSIVLMHAELKAMQLGAGVGLLVAIPGVAWAPETFNKTDAPPLVAAAAVAGSAAAAGAALVLPVTAFRLIRDGMPGVRERASLLRSNERQAQLRNIVGIGAATGLALEGVRLSAIADMHNVPVSTVATTRQSAWELFCFAVVGATIAVAIPTTAAYIRENWPVDSEDVKQAADNIEQGAKDAKNEAKDKAQKAASKADEAVDEAADTAENVADEAGDAADEAADEVGSGFKEISDGVANGTADSGATGTQSST